MREQDDQGARNNGGRVGGGNLSSAGAGIAGARTSVDDDESSIQTASMRLAIGRQHFGGSIVEFETDASDHSSDASDHSSDASDHSSEDEEAALSNQPVRFFAP